MTNPHFTITGIPEQLGPRPDGNRRPLTLGELNQIMWRDRQFVLPISGGWAAVDIEHFPAPPRYKNKGGDGSADSCLCYATFPEQPFPTVMCKEYMGLWGSWHMVGTRYDLAKGKHPYNCGMRADAIFGVIYASWDADGRLLWKRDPEGFPKALATTPTIRGGSVGDPAPLRRATV